MSKTPEEYRQEAKRIREMVPAILAPDIRAALEHVAAIYEGLAHAAETIAALNSQEFAEQVTS
jgi:hypothetical protein